MTGKEERSDSEIIIHKARTIITEDKIVKLTLLHNLPVSEENHDDHSIVFVVPILFAE